MILNISKIVLKLLEDAQGSKIAFYTAEFHILSPSLFSILYIQLCMHLLVYMYLSDKRQIKYSFKK